MHKYCFTCNSDTEHKEEDEFGLHLIICDICGTLQSDIVDAARFVDQMMILFEIGGEEACLDFFEDRGITYEQYDNFLTNVLKYPPLQ